ncbi:hypothetical protein [Chamaesiphon minutus]|uniref:Uncharacterized protein n=1 Tax=Chamaesiphon minutus (strain ATCC 27169 / PCC 6605) TaxID=1173020 RepID=K9UMQ2_CHAP6|nr:hypothetical protein [Chamaesiphon minutus]AFY96372.1 hypothetical protein Cha6605_5489 [Chamaesiphon minutus PCC 6605]
MNKAVIASIVAGGMWGNIVAPSVPPAMAQSLPSVQPTATTPNPIGIELLDAGAEPRRELKFTPAINSKQTMTMTMDMSMEMTIGETPIPKTPLPKMVLNVDSTVKRVDPSGDIHCQFAYSDLQAIGNPDTAPELLAAIQKSLKSLVGIKLDMVIGGNGQVKSKKLIIPKTVDPKLKNLLEQFDRSMSDLSTQLPTERVGLGAKWRINNSIKISGINLVQSATSEIVEIDNMGVKIKTQMTQSAPPQDLNIPGTTPDVKSRLTSMASSGEGSYLLRFNSLLPVTGKFAAKTDSKLSVQSGSKEPPTDMSTKISIDLDFDSK